jgi:hypothetical protein
MDNAFDTAFWAAALRPFAMLLILTVFGIPITMAVRRWWPQGRLKRLLLDRSMTDRKPWVAWVAFFACYAAMLLGAWIGLTLNH